MSRPGPRGFTLIELLVVIAIIGLLSSIVLASLNTARGKARDAHRLSELHQVEIALELYYSTYGSYPPACGGTLGVWKGHGSNFGDCNTDYIQGLTPYLSTLPIDPAGDNIHGYIYRSVGTNYKFMSYVKLESSSFPQGTSLARCPSTCVQSYCSDTNSLKIAAVYSNGAACW